MLTLDNRPCNKDGWTNTLELFLGTFGMQVKVLTNDLNL